MTAPAFAVTGPGAESMAAAAVAPLTIHKHAGVVFDEGGGSRVAMGQAGDGTQQTVSSAPLAGEKFLVEQVNGVDLKTAAGWQAAQDMNPATADVTTVGTYTTGADGSVKIDLPLGLYRVTETQAPTGYNSTNGAFLVTLPMANPENRSEWMYDVHVYPKNNPVDETLPIKTVVDANKNAGDVINYTINAPVQQVQDDLSHFRIVDKYPSDRLEKPVVDGVTFNGAPTGNQLIHCQHHHYW